VDSETESDEKPLTFKRPKPSTKGPHLEQNIKQNTDFYKSLLEVKMWEKTQKKKKKKKSSKPKLSAVSTKGKSSENTTSVSSEAQILGIDLPLRTCFSEPQPEIKPVSLSSDTPSSNELNQEINQVLKEIPKAIKSSVVEPKPQETCEQDINVLDNLSSYLSPDSLSNTPIKQIPSSTLPPTHSICTSPTKISDMITDSTFSIEEFSILETEPLFTVADTLYHQITPSKTSRSPSSEPYYYEINLYQSTLTMDDIWIPSECMTKTTRGPNPSFCDC
jgi:hypothetical protein